MWEDESFSDEEMSAPDAWTFALWDDAVPCPCCAAAYRIAPQEGDCCPVCGWEIDQAAQDDPTQPSQANEGLSLEEAQMNFRAFGSCMPWRIWE